MSNEVSLRVHPPLGDDELNELFTGSWPGHEPRAFAGALVHSLSYVGAFAAGRLVGFVNLAWDGGLHAFLLDTTVHPDWRRRGVGRRLVAAAAEVAREQGVAWLHVDYEPRYEGFYRACGFGPTRAGLMALRRGGA